MWADIDYNDQDNETDLWLWNLDQLYAEEGTPAADPNAPEYYETWREWAIHHDQTNTRQQHQQRRHDDDPTTDVDPTID